MYVRAMPMYAKRGRQVAATCALLRWVLERELKASESGHALICRVVSHLLSIFQGFKLEFVYSSFSSSSFIRAMIHFELIFILPWCWGP